MSEFNESSRNSTTSWIITAVFGWFILAALILTISKPQTSSETQTIADGEPQVQALTDTEASCNALIELALQTSNDRCQSIGSNQVCYGNDNIEAGLAAGTVDLFETPGDAVPVEQVDTLFTSPLDPDLDQWGIAFFKLRANLPGTVPGQNVTFLVTGNTALENTSGDMQAFYFKTGFGGLQCEQLPFEGIVVDTPDGGGITFEANGVSVTLTGTAALEATEDADMNISLLRGSGRVASGGEERSLESGESINIQLGGSNGLQPVGPLSLPRSNPPEVAAVGCQAVDLDCDKVAADRESAGLPALGNLTVQSGGDSTDSNTSSQSESGPSSGGSRGFTLPRINILGGAESTDDGQRRPLLQPPGSGASSGSSQSDGSDISGQAFDIGYRVATAFAVTALVLLTIIVSLVILSRKDLTKDKTGTKDS